MPDNDKPTGEEERFNRSTGEEERHRWTEHGEAWMSSGPLMDRFAARPVIVVSFWPGNGSQSAVGGFDWREDDSAGRDWLLERIAELGGERCFGDPNEHSSLSVVRLWVPNRITDVDQVSEYIKRRPDAREVSQQDFSDLPLAVHAISEHDPPAHEG